MVGIGGCTLHGPGILAPTEPRPAFVRPQRLRRISTVRDEGVPGGVGDLVFVDPIPGREGHLVLRLLAPQLLRCLRRGIEALDI